MDATGVLNRFIAISNTQGYIDPKVIADTIRVTDTWLSENSDVVVARTLHSFLPTLCTILFGSKGGQKNGVFQNIMSNTERQLWLNFLHPKGPLFTKLIRLQNDQTLQYEITVDNLPSATKHIFETGDLNALPLFYKSRIKLHTKAAATIPNQSSPQQELRKMPTVMFNMLEYFIFCFAYVVTLVTYDGPLPSSQSKLSPRSSTTNGYTPQVHQTLDDSYFTLLNNYLAFFLPKPVGARKKESIIPESVMTPGRFDVDPRRRGESGLPSITSRNSTSKLTQPDITASLESYDVFSSRDTDSIMKALSISEFFVGAVLDLWLGENEINRVGASEVKLWTYAKPNRFIIEGTRLIISHLQFLGLSTQSLEAPLSQSRLDVRERDDAHDLATLSAYRILRPALYRFLKAGLENWPREDSIDQIVDLWLLYLCPWKSEKSKYSNAWSTFVRENFPFYSVILLSFIRRAQTFDIYSSVRPLTKSAGRVGVNAASTSSSKKYLILLENTIAVYTDDQLFSVLRTLEAALCSLDQYANGLEATTPLSSRSRRPHTPSLERSPRLRRESSESFMDRMYSFQNSGPSVRNQLYLLEGRSHYVPVFDISLAADQQNSLQSSMTKIVYAIYGSIERLSYLRESAEKLPLSPPGSPYPTRSSRSSTHPSSTSSATTKEPNVWDFIKDTFGIRSSSDTTTGRSSSSLSRDQLEQINRDIQRLEALSNQLIDIWGLPVDASVVSVLQQGHEDTQSLLSEDGDRSIEIAPGVRSPDLGNGNAIMTSRGRLQVKRGLRKCESDSVTAIPSPRVERMIKTSEVKFLVTLLVWLGTQFDIYYAKMRQSYTFLPVLPSFKMLRWFAAIPNQVTIVILYITLRVLLTILSWFFFSASSRTASTTTGSKTNYASSSYQSNAYRASHQYGYGNQQSHFNYHRNPY